METSPHAYFTSALGAGGQVNASATTHRAMAPDANGTEA